MDKTQRELEIKLNNNTLTKEEYKQLNKSLYSFFTRVELFKKYHTGIYYIFYIIWLVLISTVTSLVVVNLAVM